MTEKIWLFDPKNPHKTYKTEDFSRVLVGGCFDVLHFGHIKFLEAAKALGNFLSIALESDEKIHQTKNRPTIHSQAQRAEILSHLCFVDEIILLPMMQNYEDYLNLVQHLKPRFLAITAGDPQLQSKQKQVETIGGELVIVVDNIPSFSSSHLIKEKDWI